MVEQFKMVAGFKMAAFSAFVISIHKFKFNTKAQLLFELKKDITTVP